MFWVFQCTAFLLRSIYPVLIYPAFSESWSDVSSLPLHYTAEKSGVSICMAFFRDASDVHLDNSHLSEIAGDLIIHLTTISRFQFFIQNPDVDDIELIFS